MIHTVKFNKPVTFTDHTGVSFVKNPGQPSEETAVPALAAPLFLTDETSPSDILSYNNVEWVADPVAFDVVEWRYSGGNYSDASVEAIEIIPEPDFSDWTGFSSDVSVPDGWDTFGTHNTNDRYLGVAGGLQCLRTDPGKNLLISGMLVAGLTYDVEYEYSDKTSGEARVAGGLPATTLNAAVNVRDTKQLTATDTDIQLGCIVGGTNVTLSYLSIKLQGGALLKPDELILINCLDNPTFPPLVSSDADLIYNEDLTALPDGWTSNRDGEFVAGGYTPRANGSLTIPTTIENTDDFFISYTVESFGVTIDDSLVPAHVTQSTGYVRGVNGASLAFVGDTAGNTQRIQLYNHPQGTMILYGYNGAATIVSGAITSLGKGERTRITVNKEGDDYSVYANGALIGSGTFSNYDTNQFKTIYLGAQNDAGSSPFGDFVFSDFQLSKRPIQLARINKTLTMWGDSFIESGFGALGGDPVYGVRNYDVVMQFTVANQYVVSNTVNLVAAGYGYSGYAWSDTASNPQTGNGAAIAAEASQVLLLSCSVNDTNSRTSLAADYQSSLEAIVDYQVANNTNLETLLFVSMSPYTQNPNNVADKTAGVIEEANAVFAGLVSYVNTNHPDKKAIFCDMFTACGGHEYPATWTYGVVSATDDIHPSAEGHLNIGLKYAAYLRNLLIY